MDTDTQEKEKRHEKTVIILAILAGLIFFAYFLLDWSSLYTQFKSKIGNPFAKAAPAELVSTKTETAAPVIEKASLAPSSLASETEADYSLAPAPEPVAVKEATVAPAVVASAPLTTETETYDLDTAVEVEADTSGFYIPEEDYTVFVKSSDDLPERAQSLFSRISDLEGKSPSRIKSIYKDIDSDLKSESLLRIKFNSGSSNLSVRDVSKIKSIVKDSASNCYFLAVGFADTSGDALGNEKLSSKRATAVAQTILDHKQLAQKAQSVYLGQTTRFGEQSENRVVEIWKITK